MKEPVDIELLRNGEIYDENYFERGADLGLSNYRNYTFDRLRPWCISLINLINMKHEDVLSPLIHIGRRKVLDVGCGKGFFLKNLLDTEIIKRTAIKTGEAKLVGIDISGYAINNGIEDEDILLIKGDVCQMPFVDKEFDVVTGFDILEHIPSPDYLNQAINEVTRVAKEFIVIYMPVWHNDNEFDQSVWSTDRTHVSVYSIPWWIREFDKRGFVVVCQQTMLDRNCLFIFKRRE